MGISNRRFLTQSRALPCDILHFASRIPLVPAETSIHLGPVAAARGILESRISWAAIFMKAYGLVSNRCPWLRQSYMPLPIPHIYQHGRSVCSIVVQRQVDEVPRLCWGRVVDPGGQSLPQIEDQLTRFKNGPPEKVFRKQFVLSRFPWPLRRLIWRATLHVSGQLREKRVGTFTMSSLAGQGVINRGHPTLCTSSLTYGPIDSDGNSLVTLIYDHRLFDGAQAAEALNDLRDFLQQDILAELNQLPRQYQQVA